LGYPNALSSRFFVFGYSGWSNANTLHDNFVKLTEKHASAHSGVFIAMDEAVRASQTIPEGMTAAQAANEFLRLHTSKLDRARRAGKRYQGNRAVLARHHVMAALACGPMLTQGIRANACQR
jgi:hypothetical protein